MGILGGVPRLSYEDIRRRADDFRERSGLASALIFPIEEVVDLCLGIDIVPVPDLWRQHRAKGVLASDLSTIWIDQYCSENFEETYRFTLAHEAGHRELHSDIYSKASMASVTEWRDRFADLLSDEEYGWLEWQAESFAGLVLVPPALLGDEYDRASPPVVDLVSSAIASQLNLDAVWDAAVREFCERVAPRFLVSPKAVEARLHYDGLKEDLRARIVRARPEVT